MALIWHLKLFFSVPNFDFCATVFLSPKIWDDVCSLDREGQINEKVEFPVSEEVLLGALMRFPKT